jgi:hypothetical protein
MSTYRFYVYAYIRSKDSSTAKAGTPYYIGKGCGKRAFKDHNRTTHTPENKSDIIIIKENISEEEAFSLERILISKFGRVDQGNGILRNFTNGGEGSTGYLHNEQSKIKIKLARAKQIITPEHAKAISKGNTGKTIDSSTIDKISKSVKIFHDNLSSVEKEVRAKKNSLAFTGRKWFNDGKKSYLIFKEDSLPHYKIGRLK